MSVSGALTYDSGASTVRRMHVFQDNSTSTVTSFMPPSGEAPNGREVSCITIHLS
jgi:hypothetical protein